MHTSTHIFEPLLAIDRYKVCVFVCAFDFDTHSHQNLDTVFNNNPLFSLADTLFINATIESRGKRTMYNNVCIH